EELSDADARRRVLPAATRMTMAGTVSHLRWAERCWFEVVFLARPAAGPQFNDGPEGAGPVVPGRPLAQLLADYERQCSLSHEIAAAHSVGAGGKPPGWRAAAGPLRWIMTHMVEEPARQGGHMDAIGGLLAGEKGCQ